MALIDRRAWLIASGVGIVVAALIGGLSIVLSKLGPDPSDPQAIMAPPVYYVITCIGLIAYVVYVGIGIVYAWMARRSGSAAGPGPMALGGLASVVSVLIFQFIMGLCNMLLISRETMDASLAQFQNSGIEIPPGSEPLFLVGTLCLSMCFALILGGGLGAGAAAIYAAVAAPRTDAAPPA